MPRGLRTITVLASVAAAFSCAGAAIARQPVARAAASCSVGAGRGYGYTYLTSLTVRGTSCATGKTIVRHHGDVHRWHCSKKRLATSPVQYYERETCTSGSRRVEWAYSENT